MTGDGEFSALLDRVREGSQEAAVQLLQEHGPLLLAVVRRNLDRRLRAKFDSVDFVQTIWASFFARAAKQERFETPANLAAFLTQMARHKLASEHRRRFRTAKFTIDREASLDPAIRDGLPGSGPTPSQVVIAKEVWEQLVAGQPPRYRQIVELRIEGLTLEEIGDRLQINERTVRRVLAHLRMPEND